MAQTKTAPTRGAWSQRAAAEVRAWRARLGLSQMDVAAILGLSQPQISARLSGKIPFQLDELEALAGAWGISELELLGSHVPEATVGRVLPLTRDDGMSRFTRTPSRGDGITFVRMRRLPLVRLRCHSRSRAA